MRSRPWLLAFGFWTLLALSYALSAGLSEIGEGNPPTWGRMLVWNLTNFWLWMLLAPLVGWLGRRTADRGWGRFCMVHFPASLVMAFAQALVRISIFWVLCGPRQPTVHTLGQYMEGEFVGNFHLSLLTYWIMLAVVRGLESRRNLQNERMRNAQLETQLAQSQLHALRMQLQPHFLFNTLNAISALALADPVRARRMIARLGDLLRLTLEERHSPLVPLTHELELVRRYVEIQKERFGDRLETRFDVDGDTLHAAVPGMILQPLVENALRHGLLAKPTRGNLVVRIRRADGLLHLTVEDDGLGLPADGGREGVGLATTRERLRVLFEGMASLQIHKREGGGTLVELRMPFRAAVAAA